MKRYIKSATDWYFGKDERELIGDLISDMFSGWIISKRVADEGKKYSLDGIAKVLQETYPERCHGYELKFGAESQEMDFNLYTILGALEGMCHHNEAVEVADGFYYVGSYKDWQLDSDAHDELAVLSEE